MGVRLYEPVRAVLAATADLKLLRNDGSRIILTDCAADDIEQERRNAASPNSYIETKKSCVSGVNLNGPNIDLRVEFSEDLPRQPGCMLVSKVYYSQGGSDNDASKEEWAKGLTGKYGKPNNPDAFFRANLRDVGRRRRSGAVGGCSGRKLFAHARRQAFPRRYGKRETDFRFGRTSRLPSQAMTLGRRQTASCIRPATMIVRLVMRASACVRVSNDER
jgi:hypothetical protein